MNPALTDEAVEGIKIALKAVDAILETLLEQIQIEVRKIERRRDSEPAEAFLGAVVRLTVQKQTIADLRVGIPAAIRDGNNKPLSRIVNLG